jgi:hypothetical protein
VSGVEEYTLWVQWPARQENRTSCAARLRRFLDAFPTCAAGPGWRSGENAVDLNVLAPLFERRRFRKDPYPRRAHPEHGFQATLWRETVSGDTCSIALRPGAYGHPSRSLNTINVMFNRRLPLSDEWTAATLRSLLVAAVSAWDASDGYVGSNSYLLSCGTYAAGNGVRYLYEPKEGWITYLSAEQVERLEAPDGVSVEILENGGALYTLCEEQFTPKNSLHAQRAAAMQKAMEPVQYQPYWATETPPRRRRDPWRPRWGV